MSQYCIVQTLLKKGKRFSLTAALFAIFAFGPRLLHAAENNPITVGNARMTFITDNLVRLEYAMDGKFLDDSTLFAINRAPKDVHLTTVVDGNRYKFSTPVFTIEYTDNGCPFGQNNLKALWEQDNQKKTWNITKKNYGNLGGPVVTLDEAWQPLPLQEGLLSRDGWYLINDTAKDIYKNGRLHLRDRSHVQDMYLFVYGDDYHAAMKSLSVVSGPVPMTRKYMHGAWYCRWWSYTADDYRTIVREYKDHDFPLDVLVFDMDWHRKDAKIGTGHAGMLGWTGYSWNKKLIPQPEELLSELRADNIYVTVNDHPHDGIRPGEDCYQSFMADMGLDVNDPMPYFDAGDPAYMKAFFNNAHRPNENMGVAFWWLDWQQDYAFPIVRGTTTKHLSWLNELYYNDSRHGGQRGAGFSRWGGWGDHRHPIQFSGDVGAAWNMLEYEVDMTTQSGNAGCFFWAHDIGGFITRGTPELYTRWTQYGLLNSSLRIHSCIGEDMDRRPWLWGEREEAAMRKIYHMRSVLMPYIYSSVRQCHTETLPLLRGLYFDCPRDEESYIHPGQFMFGDLILGAPITQPGAGPDYVVKKEIYFPQGNDWYSLFDHRHHRGGSTEVIPFKLEETPVFAKGGYPIPMQPYTQRMASAPLDTLVIRCYPGKAGEYTLYEDDGVTEQYLEGSFATTLLTYTNENDRTRIRINPAVGTYSGQPQKRNYRIELPDVESECSVRLNGKKTRFDYNPEFNGIVIEVPSTDIRKMITVDISAH